MAELTDWNLKNCSPSRLNARSYGWGANRPTTAGTYIPNGLFFDTTDNALYKNTEPDKSKAPEWEQFISSQDFAIGNIFVLAGAEGDLNI